MLKECVEEQTCYGAVAVYRICFALAVGSFPRSSFLISLVVSFYPHFGYDRYQN